MTTCMSYELPDFAKRFDIEENGKWTPVFDGTKHNFPTCSVRAPPPLS